jgi:hypothetical protein
MAAGGANFLLFILFGGFVALLLGATVAILAMRRRAKLSDRIIWAVSSVLLPLFLILLVCALDNLEIVRSQDILVWFIMGLCVIALFSPFIVLDMFARRFPKNQK